MEITNGGITRDIDSSEYGYWFNAGYRKVEPKAELKTEPIETEPIDDEPVIVKPKPKKNKEK